MTQKEYKQAKKDRGECYNCKSPAMPGATRCEKCIELAHKKIEEKLGRPTVPKVARKNICGHPDRPHQAKGMCTECYHAGIRAKEERKPHKNGKGITDAEVKKACKAHISYRAASDAIGMARITFYIRCQKLGIKPLQKHSDEQIKKAYESFGSYREGAESLGMSSNTFSERCKALGLGIRRGFQISKEQVLKAYEACSSDREASVLLGISLSAFSNRREDLGLPVHGKHKKHRMTSIFETEGRWVLSPYIRRSVEHAAFTMLGRKCFDDLFNGHIRFEWDGHLHNLNKDKEYDTKLLDELGIYTVRIPYTQGVSIEYILACIPSKILEEIGTEEAIALKKNCNTQAATA